MLCFDFILENIPWIVVVIQYLAVDIWFVCIFGFCLFALLVYVCCYMLHWFCLHIWFLFVIYLISVSYIFDFLLVIYIWFLFAYLVFLWSCARPGVCLAGWHPETLTHAPGQRSLHIIYIIIIVIIIIKTTTIIIINNNTISAIILIGFVLSFLTFFSPASSSTAQN